MPKKYVVRLSPEERERLQDLVSKGKTQAYRVRPAHVLLKADVEGPAWLDRQITEAFSCHRSTVEGIRKRFVLEGLDSALERKKRAHPPTERKLDGAKEARLIAWACSEPPKGYKRWTLKLLADELVALEIVDSISYRTVQRTLKKNKLRPHLRRCWVIPPKQNAAFVAAMEDVLDVYQRPYDANKHVVNMDEHPLQLVKETRSPVATRPGQCERYDYEYERNGTAVNFMFTEPLAGWRKVGVRERKTAVNWAREIKDLLDTDYPEAETVVLVCDNWTFAKWVFPADASRFSVADMRPA